VTPRIPAGYGGGAFDGEGLASCHILSRAFDHPIQGPQRLEQVGQVGQREHVGAVTGGVIRVRMRFQKDGGDAGGGGGSGQDRHMVSFPAAGGALGAGKLDAVGGVEDHREAGVGQVLSSGSGLTGD